MKKIEYYAVTYISGKDDRYYTEELKSQKELMEFIAVIDYYDGEIMKVEKLYA